MHAHFELTSANIAEVNKQFADFDNMQALFLDASFICAVPGIYLRNSCRKASK